MRGSYPRAGASAAALVFVTALVLVLWPATPAQAHAVLVETDPAADTVVADSPDRVVATFNEPVEVAFGALRVYDTDGERVDDGDSEHPGGDSHAVAVRLQSDLPAGTYTATYRVVSADGHPVEAAFVFHVEEPGERPQGIASTILGGDGDSGAVEQVAFTLVRWLLFGSLMLLIGLVGFLVLVWSRPGHLATPAAADTAFVRRWRALAVWAWAIAALATIAGFFLQGAIAADLPILEALAPDVGRELLQTRYGQVAAVRLLVLVVLAVGWIVGMRTATARAEWPLRHPSTAGAASSVGLLPRAYVLGASALAAVLAATPGLSGHAGATSPVWVNASVDAFHVVAAGVWIGGLVVLVRCAYAAVGSIERSARVGVLGPVIGRFSDVALVSVGVLVATGVYRSWIEVRSFGALFEAPYGWALLTKVALFVPLLALGAVNNKVLKPRIAATTRDGAAAEKATSRLRRMVAVEVALGAFVVGVTAVLVNLAPARVEAGVTGPFVLDVALGDDNLNLVVDPNEVGENFIHLTVTTPDGTAAPVKGIKVRFSMPAEDIGPITTSARNLGPGHFVLQGRELSIPGDWILEIEARIDRFTNARVEVKVPVDS